MQHGLRPKPSFARFLGLPKEIRFPIWTSIRPRDASLVAPVHSYFRSAHSGVGEASPHGYTFPAPVRTHRTTILTIPAVPPIVRAPAPPDPETPEPVYPIVRVTRQRVLWGGYWDWNYSSHFHCIR
jgi:hypothetical protein